MRELLVRRPDIDGVFAASDVMAAGARAVLREAGRRVPEDVALVGFEDSAIARHMDPALTSVRQPLDEVAEHVLALLGRTDEHDPPHGVLLDPELVIRASSTPAGNRPTEGSST